jgi:hypothetical protein
VALQARGDAVSGETLSAQAEGVRRLASELAGPLARIARRSASLAGERALLRLLGIDGLDRDERPLAASVASRYCSGGRDRLAGGLLLPLAAALGDGDTTPRDLAIEVAAGTIELATEAELRASPEKLAAARRRAVELVGAAISRVDANRTAVREMRMVLARPAEPMLGIVLEAAEVIAAATEARQAVAGGAGLVEVAVPAGWELAQARHQAGLAALDPFAARPRGRGRRAWESGRKVPPGRDPVPAGSQRGLAQLRQVVDDAAAARGLYVALMTVTAALAAPEQAVVAAFERIDVVEADPVREIVEENVDPGRALADHAFAHRLHARAGSAVLIGPGPLVLGADLARGIPSDGDTRAGRALALQALGLELALADGLPASALMLGAVPEWIAAETVPEAILVGAWLRRALFDGHRLVVAAPTSGSGISTAATIAAALAGSPAALVLERTEAAGVATSAAELKAMAAASATIRAGLGNGSLWGSAAARAERVLAAASITLERLGGDGWASVLGPDANGEYGGRFGGSTVVERSDGPAASGPLLDELL